MNPSHAIGPITRLKEEARRKVPRFLFDYLDGGALSEQTLEANLAAFEKSCIRQRVLSDVGDVSTGINLLGEQWALPLALAPVGLGGMFARRGECQAVRSADAAGVPFTLSTLSLCSLEEVRSVSQRFWLQLYIMRDRRFFAELLERAQAAGIRTLVMTVDLAVPGVRYRDRASGLSAPQSLKRQWQLARSVAARPGWVLDVGLFGRPHGLGNIASVLGQRASIDQFWAWVGENIDPSVSWNDLEKVRKAWPGRLVVKGILDPDDARRAIGCGADGVVVSNHGGRQLDGARSSLSALNPVAESIGRKVPVLLDGGVRSGADIFRAIALGASAVLIGRPWVYGLAARGQAGVAEVIATLHAELMSTMALAGCTRIADIGPDAIEAMS